MAYVPSPQELIERLNAIPVGNRLCVCIYCGSNTFDYTPLIPPVSDERGWRLLALLHYSDCEWIRRKAFQLALED